MQIGKITYRGQTGCCFRDVTYTTTVFQAGLSIVVAPSIYITHVVCELKSEVTSLPHILQHLITVDVHEEQNEHLH